MLGTLKGAHSRIIGRPARGTHELHRPQADAVTMEGGRGLPGSLMENCLIVWLRLSRPYLKPGARMVLQRASVGSAVDQQCLAGDVAARLTGQQESGACEFTWSGPAFQGGA